MEIEGLVFFHADGTVGVIVRLPDGEYRLNGEFDQEELTAEGGGIALTLNKEESPGNGPAAKGKIETVDGEYPVCGWRVQFSDGTSGLGLSLDEVPERVECPW